MATVTWKGGTNLWDNNGSWTDNAPPQPRDTALLQSAGTLTIDPFPAENPETVGGVTIDNAGATLDVQGTLNIGTVGGGSGFSYVITVTAGRFLIDGAESSVIVGNQVTGATGKVEIDGGTYRWDGAGSTQTIVFDGGATAFNSTFQIISPFGGQVSGFGAGEFITWSDINPITSSKITQNQVVLTDSVGATRTVKFVGDYNASNLMVDGSTITTTVACYVGGTRIMTEAGEIAVEALQPGDRVWTRRGGQAVVCIGHRRVDTGRVMRPATAWPVRIRAGAFGPGLPQHDLSVSPEHLLFLDDALIPARLLVNGHSVVQDIRHVIDYYHVVLPEHDVLLAEGLPAESWLDTGNRTMFDQALPDGIAPVTPFAPLVTNGAVLDAVRARLRAGALLAA